MLEIHKIKFSNFLSYGDYVSELVVDGLGQCLITGENICENEYDETLSSKKSNNGCGKSTISNVIQWVLFGRTMHNNRPGDKVINYFTGKDCVATLELKSGDSITRIRRTSGHTELLYTKNGEEHKLVADTVSTAQNQQRILNKTFNLDWDLFTGSVFFNQYGKPWLEMADSVRKKTLERMLHIDKFQYYADAAKSKFDNITSATDRSRNKLKLLESEVIRINNEIENNKLNFIKHDSEKKLRSDEILLKIKEIEKKQSELNLPDIEALFERWDNIRKIEVKINSFKDKVRDIELQISKINFNIKKYSDEVDEWKRMAGTICVSCKQKISNDFTGNKIQPIMNKLLEENKVLNDLIFDKNKLNDTILTAIKMLNTKKPEISYEDAKSLYERNKQYENEIKRLKNLSVSILNEENPYTASADNFNNKLTEIQLEINKLKYSINENNILSTHYSYIYKSYNDRNKIKSFVFADHVPFINKRLKYYLDVFGLDIKIELTNNLSVNSSMWGYDYESGGERKRTDLAFMFAIYDFHEYMYERQSNIIFLDEVDGRLDDSGVDCLINIIKNDLSHKCSTVFVISHRNMMHDVFTNEIKIKRVNRFSYISDV